MIQLHYVTRNILTPSDRRVIKNITARRNLESKILQPNHACGDNGVFHAPFHDNFRRERIRGDPVNQREFKSELDVEKYYVGPRFLSLQRQELFR
jgi:hypothetical protein